MALRLGPALLILISFVAILLGIILHSTSINELQYRGPPQKEFEQNVIIDDKNENLIWFLQVTDLHLSNRGTKESLRERDFHEFARDYVDIVKPDVVLVTGDITDGRKPNSSFGTGPQLDEWLGYSSAIERSGALTKTKWLDIRGNHDNFNVYRPADPNTLYRKYSIQGKEWARNYMYNLTARDGMIYNFIGVDEVQTPGLKIPFNFIGVVKADDVTQLKKFKEEAKKMNGQYSIWFAHYPTSSIASTGENLRNIIDGPYLCGHFHTIGNWVTQMHATQQPGFAEIELGDWKHNRRIRLAAVDHQLFSFVDVGFREFPIALMTNPKRTECSMPKYEPVGRIQNSTHIRVIAFSNSTIKKVTISIDGQAEVNMKSSSGPLYVLPWKSIDYSTGLHTATIYVEDKAGLKRNYTQNFSLDHSKAEFSLGGRILLRGYFKSYVMSMFFFTVTICTLPMLILRLVGYRHEDTTLKRHYRDTFIYGLHLLSNIRRLYLPLFIIPIWLTFCPLFIGRLVDEAIGICFVWGILIDGTFIHTGLTYNVCSIYLLFLHIPEIVLLTYQVKSSKLTLASSLKPSIMNLRLIIHICLTALQAAMGSVLYSAYGTMALLTSIQFFWCIFTYAYCWYLCTTLERSDFVQFDQFDNQEEQQALTGQKARDDKSSTSDHSSC